MKSIFSMIKNIYISLLLIVTAIFIGCSDDDGEKIPYKGATTQLMQGIADNVSYIQQIQKEEIIKISDGVSVTDVSFVYCTKPTRMLIAEIDLNKNVTIVTSTPDNKDEVGKVTQTVKQQAMKAEESGNLISPHTIHCFASFQRQAAHLLSGKPRSIFTGQIAFENLNIFPVKRRLMMIVTHQTPRLEFAIKMGKN